LEFLLPVSTFSPPGCSQTFPCCVFLTTIRTFCCAEAPLYLHLVNLVFCATVLTSNSAVSTLPLPLLSVFQKHPPLPLPDPVSHNLEPSPGHLLRPPRVSRPTITRNSLFTCLVWAPVVLALSSIWALLGGDEDEV
jgi:hypothetical protein